MEEQLEPLRRTCSSQELVRLGSTVRTHAAMLDEASLTTPHIDYHLAQRMSEVLCALIDRADDLGNDGRSWVFAAARYFITTDDELSDLGVDGLHDDAAAVIWVCDRLGLSELGAPLLADR